MIAIIFKVEYIDFKTFDKNLVGTRKNGWLWKCVGLVEKRNDWVVETEIHKENIQNAFIDK